MVSSAPETGKPSPPPTIDLNEAALALLRAAPPPIHDVVVEICRVQHCQPWHLLVGHLIRADQRAELHAPMLLPEWTTQSPTPEITRSGDRICKACRRPMVKAPDYANFCCNFCGSGRWDRDQTHHPDCEFFIKPRSVLKPERLLPNSPPEDPAARLLWEEAMFQRHLEESQAADNAPGGLPPLPELEERPAARY